MRKQKNGLRPTEQRKTDKKKQRTTTENWPQKHGTTGQTYQKNARWQQKTGNHEKTERVDKATGKGKKRLREGTRGNQKQTDRSRKKTHKGKRRKCQTEETEERSRNRSQRKYDTGEKSTGRKQTTKWTAKQHKNSKQEPATTAIPDSNKKKKQGWASLGTQTPGTYTTNWGDCALKKWKYP